MIRALSILTIIFFTTSCIQTVEKHDEVVFGQQNNIQDTMVRMQTEETNEMIQYLQGLLSDANPQNYLHLNKSRADLLKKQLDNKPPGTYDQIWFEYCTQLLRAGETENCISELESHFDSKIPYEQQMSPNNYLLFELLAIAYLRLGEEQNCQANHNAYSCIVPLKEPAYHVDKKGSRSAINLYQSMYDKMPSYKYKWLINLAYMTLGEYPSGVPEKYFLSIPLKNESKDFKRFNEVAMNTGVAYNGLSGGVCLEDFNGDGLIDIFVTAYGLNENVVLYQNTGKGYFEDVTDDALLKGIVSGLNCVHADYDNDGYSDILILRGAWLNQFGNHANSLLHNNGDGTFDDVTKSSGLLSYHPTQAAGWADYNRDGFLDLFIANEDKQEYSSPCELYQNNGDGTFTEVSQQVGIGQLEVFAKGVSWGDIDNDGWPDLFVSVMRGPNLLFKNNHGQFENITDKAGITEPLFSFSSWFWDVNQDGYEDLFVASYNIDNFSTVSDFNGAELMGEPTEISKPVLYINNGDNTFTDQTKAYNLDKSMFAMGSNFGDLDNDGYLDFYVGTGSPDYTAVVPNRMFRNVGGRKFEEVTAAGGFGHIQKGHGIGFADIDNDGDQDVYAVMGGAFEGDVFTNVLFENTYFEHNWLVLHLTGTKSNTSAIGARVEFFLNNGKKLFRTIGTGSSFGSNSIDLEIGIGDASAIDRIIIKWPSGEINTLDNVPINKKLELIEGEGKYTEIEYEYTPFSEEQHGEHHHH